MRPSPGEADFGESKRFAARRLEILSSLTTSHRSSLTISGNGSAINNRCLGHDELSPGVRSGVSEVDRQVRMVRIVLKGYLRACLVLSSIVSQKVQPWGRLGIFRAASFDW